MDMDAAINFIHTFIETEHEAHVAQYTERDDAAFARKIAKLQEFYEDMRPEPRRAPGKTEEWFVKAQGGLASVAPRVLFQVKHYIHPNLGDLYRNYTSDYLTSGDMAIYFANFYVTDIGHGPKIVSKYLICFACNGTGKVDDEPCNECGGLGWLHSDGLELKKLGTLAETRQFRPPDDPIQQEEYAAE